MLVARASSGRKIPCREHDRIYEMDHLGRLGLFSNALVKSHCCAWPFTNKAFISYHAAHVAPTRSGLEGRLWLRRLRNPGSAWARANGGSQRVHREKRDCSL